MSAIIFVFCIGAILFLGVIAFFAAFTIFGLVYLLPYYCWMGSRPEEEYIRLKKKDKTSDYFKDASRLYRSWFHRKPSI